MRDGASARTASRVVAVGFCVEPVADDSDSEAVRRVLTARLRQLLPDADVLEETARDVLLELPATARDGPRRLRRVATTLAGAPVTLAGGVGRLQVHVGHVGPGDGTEVLAARRARTALEQARCWGLPALAWHPALDPRRSARREPGRRRPARHSVRPRWAQLVSLGFRPYLVGADAVAVSAAALLLGYPAPRLAALVVLLIGLNAAAGLYRERLSHSLLDDLPAVLGRAVVATVLVGAAWMVGEPDRAGGAVAGAAAVVGGVVLATKAGCYPLVRLLRTRGVVEHPTLVLGAGQVGARIARLLIEHPRYGLRPIGFLDADPHLSPAELPAPVLGGPGALADVVVDFRVRAVVIAFASLPEAQLVDEIRRCGALRTEIFVVPRLFEVQHTGRDMEEVWGVPLVRLRRAAMRSPLWRCKRALDVLLAAVLLLVLAPVMAVIGLAVRAEVGPDIIFRQHRTGVRGQSITLLKFRSLTPADPTESDTAWSVTDDPRVGRVGRLLRATSLDELPQLWNVLRGDMTLVGPRPERPHFVLEFSRAFARYPARHRVPGGLTGWAQVHGLRGDTSIEERARFDNYYIENWSLWTDVKILLRTAAAVLRRTGG